MFVVALWAMVGTGFIPLVARAQSPSEITIEIHADIDGRSQLILRDNTAQWHHFDYAAPGRQLFTNFPTTINGVDWYPIWPDVPDAENRDCNCSSDIFTGVVPALPAQPIEIGLQILRVVRPGARCEPTGTIAIVQFPTPDNNFTTIVEFDDNPQDGSAFYDVRLRIRTLPVTVQIDVKPGSFPNSINLKSKGKVPVAILSTDDFDAHDVDPNTCVFASANPVHWQMADVNKDRDRDMLLQFMTQDLELTKNSTEGTLECTTHDGIKIVGTDSVKIVPKNNK
jgi:hypothetical protein